MRSTIAYAVTFFLFISYKSSQESVAVSNNVLPVNTHPYNNTTIVAWNNIPVAVGMIFLYMVSPGCYNARAITIEEVRKPAGHVFNPINQ